MINNKNTIIYLEDISLNDFYGEQNKNMEIILSYFPKLKIISRDREIIVDGKKDEVEVFTQKINFIITFLKKNKQLSPTHIEQLIESKETNIFLDEIT